MNIIYKFLLTFSATSWMWIVYVVNIEWTIGKIPREIFGFILILFPIMLSMAGLKLSKYLGFETIPDKWDEIELADGEFLSIYLGYFFVSLGITDFYKMLFIFIIVFCFTWISQTQYFNPVYLLFNYHYYHLTTISGTKIFMIKKGKIIRNVRDLSFSKIYRLNDTTYLGIEDRKAK